MGDAVLFGVEHQEAVPHRERVHARGDREVAPGLAAAVQHHHQRQAFAGRELQLGGAEQVVAARAGRAQRHAREPVAAPGGGFICFAAARVTWPATRLLLRSVSFVSAFRLRS